MLDAFGRPQNVVVLGGTSDIAGALVDLLAADRCRTVVLAGRDQERLSAARARAHAAGAERTEAVELDGMDPGSAGATVDRCMELVGGPTDLLVMAIGQLGSQQRDIVDPKRIADAVDVNFAWPAAAMGVAAERFRRQGCGRLVLLSSVAGLRLRPANFLYGSAKRGVDAFALALGDSLRSSGASLHVVRPGFVRTKMTHGLPPAPLASDPPVVAAAIVAGLRRDQRIIWVPPSLRWVSVLLHLVPSPLWRRLRS